MGWFYKEVKWAQTQDDIILTQKTRPEMHREVRATTNFSQENEFKCEQREDLMRKVNETAMGIRPSSSSEKKISDSRSLLSSSFRHCNMSKRHSCSSRMIKPPSSCNYNDSTGSSMPEPSSVRGKRQHRELSKTDHDAAIIKPTL
jgi:hypothetical protein